MLFKQFLAENIEGDPQSIADRYYEKLKYGPNANDAIYNFLNHINNLFTTNRQEFEKPFNRKVIGLVGKKLGLNFAMHREPITYRQAFAYLHQSGDNSGKRELVELMKKAYPQVSTLGGQNPEDTTYFEQTFPIATLDGKVIWGSHWELVQ